MRPALTDSLARLRSYVVRQELAPDRRLLVAYVAIVAMLSVYSLGFFLWNRVYLIGSDAFYYLSIADSIVESGSLRDLTSIPSQSLKTPQNGVVLVHVVLAKIGFGPEGRLAAIAVMNYLLHVGAVYPLYKIARRLGLQGTLPIATLLAVYLGAFHIYRLQLIAYNDGVFNALSIWLTYLLLVGLQDFQRGSPMTAFLSRWRLPVLALVVLAAVLVHFRLNVIIILGAAMVATVAVWRLRNVAWIAALLGVSLVSIVVPYALIESSRMSAQSDRLTSGLIGRLPDSLYELVTVVVPSLVFAPVSERASSIYFPFALVMVIGLIVGFRNREPGLIFVAASCAAAFMYVAVLPTQTSRYLVYVLPLMFLLILMWDRLRPIGYLFAGLVLVSSLASFTTGYTRSAESEFWLHLYEEEIRLPAQNPLLVADRNRHPYFFLDTRTYRGDLTWDLVTSRGQVFVVGGAQYIATRIGEIDALTSERNATYSRETLTPTYRDEDGHTLIRIYDFRTGG